MKDKKAFSRKLGDFLAGRGFYVVLFICTAVIGVSAWILLSAGNEFNESDTGGSKASVSQFNKDARVSDGNAMIPDVTGQKPEVSSTPSAAGNASAAPTAKATGGNDKASTAEDKSEAAMAKPLTFVWPIVGNIEVMYSVDELLYNKTMSDWRTHDGIDISSTIGTKVMAAADGTVADVRNDDLLGTTVVIDHGNGLQSIYANLAETPVVKKGDKVAMGSVIGAVGDTAIGESCETAHLHFAMTKDNLPVDPSKYLPKK